MKHRNRLVALTGVGLALGSLGFLVVQSASASDDAQFPVNEGGQSYGSSFGVQPDDEPDLVAAIGADGTLGYVRDDELMGEQPRNPEEAVAYMNRGVPARDIPLYAADGRTVIGSFHVSGTDDARTVTTTAP